MNEANVIQNAGAVLVVKLELFRVPTSCLTNANRAISTANAMRVVVAARNEIRDARRVTVMWVEKERRRATNDTIAARGGGNVLEACTGPMDELLITYRLGELPGPESNWT